MEAEAFLTPLASKAMSRRPHRTTRRTPTRDEERVALTRLEGVRTSGTSIRIKTPSSDVGLDYKVSCDQKIAGEQYATLAAPGRARYVPREAVPLPLDG